MESTTARAMAALLLVGVLPFGCECDPGGDGLTNLVATPVPSATAVDFGPVIVGATTTRTITIENTGNLSLRVEEVFLEGDFSFGLATPTEVAPGESGFWQVTFAPNQIGAREGRLTINTNSEESPSVVVLLEGEGVPVPECDDGNPCTVDRYDIEAVRCVFELFVGPCDDQNLCTTNDRCLDGECVGDSVDCEDGVACTLNGCNPEVGCFFAPDHAQCNDGEPCTEDRCTDTGCENPPAPDWTPCGDVLSCTSASFCFNELCTEIDPPDGAPCDDGSACTIDDRCVDEVCEGQPVEAEAEILSSIRTLGRQTQLIDSAWVGDALAIGDPTLRFIDTSDQRLGIVGEEPTVVPLLLASEGEELVSVGATEVVVLEASDVSAPAVVARHSYGIVPEVPGSSLIPIDVTISEGRFFGCLLGGVDGPHLFHGSTTTDAAMVVVSEDRCQSNSDNARVSLRAGRLTTLRGTEESSVFTVDAFPLGDQGVPALPERTSSIVNPCGTVEAPTEVISRFQANARYAAFHAHAGDVRTVCVVDLDADASSMSASLGAVQGFRLALDVVWTKPGPGVSRWELDPWPPIQQELEGPDHSLYFLSSSHSNLGSHQPNRFADASISRGLFVVEVDAAGVESVRSVFPSAGARRLLSGQQALYGALSNELHRIDRAGLREGDINAIRSFNHPGGIFTLVDDHDGTALGGEVQSTGCQLQWGDDSPAVSRCNAAFDIQVHTSFAAGARVRLTPELDDIVSVASFLDVITPMATIYGTSFRGCLGLTVSTPASYPDPEGLPDAGVPADRAARVHLLDSCRPGDPFPGITDSLEVDLGPAALLPGAAIDDPAKARTYLSADGQVGAIVTPTRAFLLDVDGGDLSLRHTVDLVPTDATSFPPVGEVPGTYVLPTVAYDRGVWVFGRLGPSDVIAPAEGHPYRPQLWVFHTDGPVQEPLVPEILELPYEPSGLAPVDEVAALVPLELLEVRWPIAYVSVQDGLSTALEGRHLVLATVGASPLAVNAILPVFAPARSIAVEDNYAYVGHEEGFSVVSPPCGASFFVDLLDGGTPDDGGTEPTPVDGGLDAGSDAGALPDGGA